MFFFCFSSSSQMLVKHISAYIFQLFSLPVWNSTIVSYIYLTDQCDSRALLDENQGTTEKGRKENDSHQWVQIITVRHFILQFTYSHTFAQSCWSIRFWLARAEKYLRVWMELGGLVGGQAGQFIKLRWPSSSELLTILKPSHSWWTLWLFSTL